jgi:hypothetical protein
MANVIRFTGCRDARLLIADVDGHQSLIYFPLRVCPRGILCLLIKPSSTGFATACHGLPLKPPSAPPRKVARGSVSTLAETRRMAIRPRAEIKLACYE